MNNRSQISDPDNTGSSNDKPTADRPVKGSTVNRVLDILEMVAASERPLSPTDLAVQLNIPKASLHRLVGALEEQGFLQTRLNQRGLQPGHRLHKVAMGVLASAPMQVQHRAILATLSEEIGETCNIAVPQGAEMIYFDRAETHWPVRVQLQIGSRVPVFATAGGKMYLSSLPRAKRESLISHVKLVPYTSNTLLDEHALHAELDATAERGYALDNEEYIDGMVALAVPLTDKDKRLYATLSFHAPCMRIPFAAVTDFLPQVRFASAKLSTLLND